MCIEIRELASQEDFRRFVEIQKIVFGVSDKDSFPLPYLTLLSRQEPSTGILLGAFSESELVGINICVATLEPNSIYSVKTGVLPEYRVKKIGKRFRKKLVEIASYKKIRYLYGMYSPLEGNIANFHYGYGCYGIKYKEDAYELSNHRKMPIDKILLKNDLISELTYRKLEGTYQKKPLDELLEELPLITENEYSDNECVLVEIPENFIEMTKHDFDEALKWRIKIRKILTEYLNNRNYCITEFYSEIIDDNRRNYYLLEKQE